MCWIKAKQLCQASRIDRMSHVEHVSLLIADDIKSCRVVWVCVSFFVRFFERFSPLSGKLRVLIAVCGAQG